YNIHFDGNVNRRADGFCGDDVSSIYMTQSGECMAEDLGLHVPPAARIGDPLQRVGTPSLVLDLDAFEFNIERMAALAAAHGVALRPHAKAHKSTAIAAAQLAAGAVGVCCQKLSEVYPFVRQ